LQRKIDIQQDEENRVRVFVSDSANLVFVHIQKTGGSTVDTLLRENVPDIYMVGAKHGFAIQGINEVKGWDERFKFAFVRNPWARLASWYNMMTRAQEWERSKGQPENVVQNKLWHYVRDNSSTFEDFVYNCTDEVEVAEGVYYSFAYNQLDYVTDDNGNLLVDFIGRFENLEKDVREVFERVGIKLASIPHLNRSSHRHYSTFYTPETEMIVRERFKKDIEYFGYELTRPHTYQGVKFTKEEFFRLERQVRGLNSRLAEERRKVWSLEETNQTLANRLERIEASRSWRLLNRLSRVQARMFRKRRAGG
jgi:chondroitin 4-sulfotransferase 11